ncbi:MAG: hypothetical protein ABI643_00530 [Candidatus Doudnabacteria bacterium]
MDTPQPNQNPTDPTYKVPPTPMTDTLHKNWFSRHMILGVVFLLAAVGAIVSGIYYWQTVRQIPAFLQVPAHKDFMADWKAYSNTKYGLEFKYPPALALTTADDNCATTDPLAAVACHGDEVYLSRDGAQQIILGINEPGSALLKQDSTSVASVQADVLKTRSIIPNSSGIKIYKHPVYRGDGKTFHYIRYSFNKAGVDYFESPDSGVIPDLYDTYVYFGSRDYFATPTSDPNFDSNQKTAELILSTFKFTTPSSTADTSTWKTYTNSQYGFEFQYPQTWVKVVDSQASSTDYLPVSRMFAAIYRTSYPAQDFSGRVDIYSVTLATVLKDDPFLKNEKKLGNATVAGISWQHFSTPNGSDYYVEKNGKVYEVSGTEEITNQILSTFKFTS